VTRPTGFAAYLVVTAAYWAFMLTDGALRMLVLLHFHGLGFSSVQLAYLFVLYEVAGMVTNLCAGWLAVRFGLATTLYAGLGLQIVALLALTQLDPSWSIAVSVAFVMCAQGVSGIAKDLTKMSSKSAVKLLAPSEDSTLFQWVAVLTGSKNVIKGLGFFLGGALLAVFGFEGAVLGMACALGFLLTLVVWRMPPGLPSGMKGAKFSAVFSTSEAVNWLSLARVFLFSARDVWFVVGVPLYFYGVWSDGSDAGNKAAFFMIGSFMALWVIGYGIVQGSAPKILARLPVQSAFALAMLLAFVPLILAIVLWLSSSAVTPLVVIGLFVFGFGFALNSALHSFLILSFSADARVSMDVGFYYMANAAGRLLGTLLSGVAYQAGGLELCLLIASLMLFLSAAVARRLPQSGVA
jgi:predicted MFS family arabinose efflux permease